MHMRNHVAEAGQIDLVWLDDISYDGFDGEDDAHQFLLLVACEIGHLGGVPVENDAAEAGIIGVVNDNDPAKRAFPSQRTTGRCTKFAEIGSFSQGASRNRMRRGRHKGSIYD